MAVPSHAKAPDPSGACMLLVPYRSWPPCAATSGLMGACGSLLHRASTGCRAKRRAVTAFIITGISRCRCGPSTRRREGGRYT
jgi:hypothetical protein